MLTDWPLYKPDLNPIKYPWYELKKLVYKVGPDIDEVTGGDDKVKEELWKALEEAWTLIDAEMVKGLMESKERRMKGVIAAERWYTKY